MKYASEQEFRAEKLFSQFNDGENDVMVELVELARPILFDYLMRMCGQHDTAMRVLDETVRALKADERFKAFGLEDFYAAVYATARSFCSHSWNANTSELENQNYRFAKTKIPELTLRQIEKALAKIPGWEREPVILQRRCGFSNAMSARIMSSPETSTSHAYKNALLKLAQACPNIDPALIAPAIEDIPRFTPDPASGASTMALSEIMGGMDEAHGSFFTVKKLFKFLIFVAVVGGVAWLLLSPDRPFK